MDKKVVLKRLNLITGLQTMQSAFDVINTERDRLSPWFWWMSKEVTPTKGRFLLFMMLYLADTKRKEMAYKFNPIQLYDEQFMIMVDEKFCGMIGFDNINNITKDAEIWYFISQKNENTGVASQSLQYITNYALAHDINRLYAKINTENERSINFVQRNNFALQKIEYGIPISKRNPKIADVMTWEKFLVK